MGDQIERRRVLITGMGVVTPIGIGLKEYWEGLVSGRSGVRYITAFDASDQEVRIAAEVRGFDPLRYVDRREAKRMDRFTQFGVAATKMAIEDAGFKLEDVDPDRFGVCLGTGVGGISTLVEQQKVMETKGPSRVSPLFIPMMIANIAAGHIAMLFGAKGPNTTVVTACASSAHAIGEGFRVVREGLADIMLVGGAEAPIVPLAVAGFASMKALSTRNDDPSRACRPFDKGRDGFVMGEGAAMLVLEEAGHAASRGAKVYAEMAGYGMSADAYHLTAPPPGGEGGVRSMLLALKDAGEPPEAVDYINAHGTSTPLNDKTETEAIKRALGGHARKVAVSSTKSMIGHLLGASGAAEMVATVLAMVNGVIPPTINYEEPDPECDLDYVPNEARPAKIRLALSNSFGFGGHNATLAVRAYMPARNTARTGGS